MKANRQRCRPEAVYVKQVLIALALLQRLLDQYHITSATILYDCGALAMMIVQTHIKPGQAYNLSPQDWETEQGLTPEERLRAARIEYYSGTSPVFEDDGWLDCFKCNYNSVAIVNIRVLGALVDFQSKLSSFYCPPAI